MLVKHDNLPIYWQTETFYQHIGKLKHFTNILMNLKKIPIYQNIYPFYAVFLNKIQAITMRINKQRIRKYRRSHGIITTLYTLEKDGSTTPGTFCLKVKNHKAVCITVLANDAGI
jgi:hypothetical protein